MIYIQNPEKFVKENPIESLDKEKAKEIYDKLVNDLNYHNYLYYVKSQPIISDYEYDLLFHYLQDLEKNFPDLLRADSPTQRLTNQIQDELKKAKHKYPLLSLENTYNPDEVAEKLEKITKEIIFQSDKKTDSPVNPTYFYVEPKYDGLSIELIYENGIFQQAITRGDGYIGEDVTENAKTIRTLPLTIPYKGKLHVRGEVVIKKSEFEKVNAKREKLGLDTYSNPRNLASGSLRQLDPTITRERNLDVVVYEILNWEESLAALNENENKGIRFHHQILDFLEEQGFFVYDFKVITEKKYNESKDKEIKKFYKLFNPRKGLTQEEVLDVVKSEKIKSILDKEDIEFDGLVIKLDNIKYWSVLGWTAHHPKWAFAFKYPAKQVSTIVLDVELSVGRTGIITPVAILEPVEIGGVVVKRATLHNFDFIKEKNIHIGDYVWIQRSGEVIPYIVGVIKGRGQKSNQKRSEEIKKGIKELIKYYRKIPKEINPQLSYLNYLEKFNLLSEDLLEDGNLIKIIEPPFCPVCGGETFHPEEEVALRCINVACPAQVKEKIVHFVSKDGLDIEGLSEKTIETFLNAGLIQDYGDIFYLPEKRAELLALPLFKEKKVENIIQAILEKTNIPLDRFLAALGIEFVGKKTAKFIVDALKNFGKSGRKFFDENNLVNFQALMDFFSSDEGYEFLLGIYGIGPKVAQSVKKFFHEEHNRKVIAKILKKAKIYLVGEKTGRFAGKSFVITGSLSGISRDEIAKFIEANGGEFSNQVTQHTSLLLVGEKPGKSKLDKAQKYNIPTADLQKWLKENGFNFGEKALIQESLF